MKKPSTKLPIDVASQAGVTLLNICGDTTKGFIAAQFDRLEIRWPDGAIDTANGVATDRFYVAREGQGIK